ncbi:hypothetical protein GPECTOR_33g578 [Gonium pectorale]|uniref:DUF155 domain-containing protein n=1 Tax=Gonium pectorale TaxID=33097 RepID=A0A150GCX8_GONPE|nr:hypothetical protein GPECTOR_33g578 [Gonium pectorale]|eukprot:KXZ47696.1 hypothetical protein GPECTOR_33g578 [Gonium pectorale]
MPGQGGPSAGGPGPSREMPGQGKKETRFGRRAVSPAQLADPRRLSTTSGHLVAAPTLTALTAARPAAGVRVRDKFVPLPDANRKPQAVAEEPEEEQPQEPDDEAMAPVVQKRGRITVITVAESFNRKALEAALQQVTVAAQAGGHLPANGTAAADGSGSGAAGAAGGCGSATVSSTGMLPPPGGAAATGGGAVPAAAAGTAAAAASTAAAAAARGGGSGGRGATAVTIAVTAYPEVTYARTVHGEAVETPGEVFFFDYGVVAFWGMTEAQEQAFLRAVVGKRGVAVELLDEEEKQASDGGERPVWDDVEELLFVYSRDSPPNIRNDTFTIDSRLANDHRVKMAISHALAQSSKLAVYEERMVGLVEEVRHVPAEMAERGCISLSRRGMAKLMGKVLQRMLDIWSDHSAHRNLARLDVAIVVLILIEVVMAGMEVLGFVVRRRGWHWEGPKIWELLLRLVAPGATGGAGGAAGSPGLSPVAWG